MSKKKTPVGPRACLACQTMFISAFSYQKLCSAACRDARAKCKLKLSNANKKARGSPKPAKKTTKALLTVGQRVIINHDGQHGTITSDVENVYRVRLDDGPVVFFSVDGLKLERGK